MKWNDLSMKDRATLILLGVASGVYDIGTIRDTYNEFAEGGEASNNTLPNGKYRLKDLKEEEPIYPGYVLPTVEIEGDDLKFYNELKDKQLNDPPLQAVYPEFYLATSLPSIATQGGWQLLYNMRKLPGFKSKAAKTVRTALARGINRANIIDTAGDAVSFVEDPNIMNGIDLVTSFLPAKDLTKPAGQTIMAARNLSNVANAVSSTHALGGPLVEAANEYRKGGSVDFSYRSEYLKKDKKLVKYLTDKAIEYGVNPYLVLDRIAKEGLVDNLIRKKASISWLSDGEERYTQAFGEIGLDDVYANAQKGVYKFHRPIPIVEEKRVNEKGRTVSSGIFNNKYDALEAYVADLAYRQSEMLKKYPHLSKDDLDALTSASYNMGLSGALKAYENNGNYKKYNILQHIKSIPLDYTSINEEFTVPLSYKDFGTLITPGRSGFMIRHGKGKNYSYPISDVSKALDAIGLSDYTNDRLDYYLIPNSSELKNKLDQFLNLLKIDLLNPQPNKNQLNILLDIYDYATEKIINYNPDYIYNNPYANLSNDLVKKNGGLLNSINLYWKGGKLQNALYWLLSHSGGGTQLGGLQYTGSYSYPNHTSILKRGNIIQTIDSSEFGGDNAVSSRDLVSLYLGLDTLGVNKLRHDTYRIGDLAYNVDFFDGKLLPLKKNKDQTYNIPQRIKTELDDLIKTDRPIKANFNALPKDTVTFAPQVLDNIQHGYIKPFIDDLGNYNLRVSKYWNLKHSLPGGKIVEDVSSGSPFVLEQIVPIRFVNNSSTPEWNAILQIKSTK